MTAICRTVPSQLTQRQERGISVTVLKTLKDEGMNRDTARLDVTTQPLHAATISRLNAVQTHTHTLLTTRHNPLSLHVLGDRRNRPSKDVRPTMHEWGPTLQVLFTRKTVRFMLSLIHI